MRYVYFISRPSKQQVVTEDDEEGGGGGDAFLTWSTSIFFMAALFVPPTTSRSNTLYQLPITGPFVVNKTKPDYRGFFPKCFLIQRL